MADRTILIKTERKSKALIVCRYLSSEGKVAENCLNVKGMDDSSAKGIFNFSKDIPLQNLKSH
jgi:hypothetical protein